MSGLSQTSLLECVTSQLRYLAQLGEKKGIHSDLVLLGIKLETQLRNKTSTKFVFPVKNCPHKQFLLINGPGKKWN